MSNATTARAGVRVLAIRLVAFIVVFAGGWVAPNGARAADDELQKARIEAGQIWYDKYCMPCHGKAGAPGSAKYRDSKQPVDLRTYVQRHGGEFPSGDWLAVVFGPQPGGIHSKVWEKIMRGQPETQYRDAAARGVVAMIADYIMLVQTK